MTADFSCCCTSGRSFHVSWSAPGALGRLLDRFIDNLRAYVAGEPPTGLEDREAGY